VADYAILAPNRGQGRKARFVVSLDLAQRVTQRRARETAMRRGTLQESKLIYYWLTVMVVSCIR